jgi:hypothetical protein
MRLLAARMVDLYMSTENGPNQYSKMSNKLAIPTISAPAAI